MTDKFQNKYRIPSARAIWHDYNDGIYFITICTAGHEHYFGKIENNEMIFNPLGKQLHKIIQDSSLHNSYAEIPLFVIMPNHVHLIICVSVRDAACHVYDANTDNSNLECKDAACQVSTKNTKMQTIAYKRGKLSTVVGGIKSATTKFAHENKITFGWQTRFHDHIIRDQEECNRIANYIETNVLNWHRDKFNNSN